MREYLSSEDICNHLSMLRSVYDGTFVIVEGVTDQRLFEKFIEKSDVRIMQAHSKDKVRSIVKTMKDRRHDDKVIGIMDPDLELVNRRRVSPPLFYTDCRDMEMMLIRSNSFEDVMDEYVDRGRLENTGMDIGTLRESIVSASSCVGKLMKVSSDNRWSLCFKNLDFSRFIDTRTLECHIDDMIEAVLANTVTRRPSRRNVTDAYMNEPDYDPWIVARGHDTVDIILLVLRKSIGAFNSRNLNEGELSGSLRLAFSDFDFIGTELYESTHAWSEESGNPLWNLVIHN